MKQSLEMFRTSSFFPLLLLCVTLLIISPTSGLAYNLTQAPRITLGGNSILYVGGNGPNNYTKIQDALDNASPGDTIYVYAGTYKESISINTPVYLIGQNRSTTILDGEFTQNIIVTIIADRTTMTGFTVKNSKHDATAAGIAIIANYTIIKNCEISYNYNGILFYCYTTRISHNLVSNNWFHHNYAGILFSGSNSEVSNNTFQYSESAAIDAGGNEVFPFYHNLIADNIMENNSDGIGFSGTTYTYQTVVTRNSIINSVYEGMWLECSDSVFSWNSIRNSGTYGVWCVGCSNNTYLHNDFINASYRLMVLECHKTPDTLRGNYWGRSHLLPKPVLINYYNRMLFTMLFDWRPAWKPNVPINEQQ